MRKLVSGPHPYNTPSRQEDHSGTSIVLNGAPQTDPVEKKLH